MHGFQERGTYVQRGRFAQTGRFGRMFPELRSLKAFDPGPEALGAVAGPMDGGNPPPSDTTQDNPRIKAGYTFLGQFIDHDLTLDATSILEQQVDINATHNFRTPALELDSLYGLGPSAQPSLYDRNNPFTFLLSEDGKDLARNRQEVALIGDPRNDENLIVSQLHQLFLKFHNKVFNDFTDPALSGIQRFETAQKLVRWHYQWIVVNEFLPRTVGSRTAARVFATTPFVFPGEPFMPVEFSGAAYRFGHTQIRPGYLINTAGAALFPDDPNAPSGNDLRGGRALPEALIIDWSRFFGPSAGAGKRVDTLLSTVILRLPTGVVPPGTSAAHRSLATRNLQRGLDLCLPSGQDVAAYLCIDDPLDEGEIWDGVPGGQGPAPLWFYLLREGEKRADGHRLAGAGAEIVGRVFAAVMTADRASYIAQDPAWTPTLPRGDNATFKVTDIVNLTLGTSIPSEDVTALPGDD